MLRRSPPSLARRCLSRLPPARRPRSRSPRRQANSRCSTPTSRTHTGAIGAGITGVGAIGATGVGIIGATGTNSYRLVDRNSALHGALKIVARPVRVASAFIPIGATSVPAAWWAKARVGLSGGGPERAPRPAPVCRGAGLGGAEHFGSRTIDLRAHPNPHGVFATTSLDEDEGSIMPLAITDDPKIMVDMLKSAAQVGLAALHVLECAYKSRFQRLSIHNEMDALAKTGLLYRTG